MKTIEQAKKVLRESGYFVDNLWHIDDVKLRYKCDDEQAQDVLNSALTNEATVEQIFFSIDTFANEDGLKPTDIED
jgi:hypothetical protein